MVLSNKGATANKVNHLSASRAQGLDEDSALRMWEMAYASGSFVPRPKNTGQFRRRPKKACVLPPPHEIIARIRALTTRLITESWAAPVPTSNQPCFQSTSCEPSPKLKPKAQTSRESCRSQQAILSPAECTRRIGRSLRFRWPECRALRLPHRPLLSIAAADQPLDDAFNHAFHLVRPAGQCPVERRGMCPELRLDRRQNRCVLPPPYHAALPCTRSFVVPAWSPRASPQLCPRPGSFTGKP